MSVPKKPALFGALLAYLLLVSVSLCAAEAAPVVALVPQPTRLALRGSGFVLGPKTVIVVEPQPGASAIAAMLAAHLHAATGYSLPIVTARSGAPTKRDAILLTTAKADPALGPEGYALNSGPEGVIVRAPSLAGLFYGTQTLRQLLPPQIENTVPTAGIVWRVPGIQIWDRPRFHLRGLMIDSARHLQSVEFLKRTLDRMAFHKLNTFHWHLSDNQGWRIEIKRLPRLTEIGAWRDENGHRYGGFYSQAEVRDIVAYAAARFITIVPELDMPAHFEAALAAYPALGCTPGPFHVLTMGEGTEDVLCPGKPAVYDFIDGVFTEVMALFPSKAIHIGGDECPKAEWKASPECQALMRRTGLKDENALQNYFTRRVAAFLTSHGRRLQGWDEILQGGPLPQNVIVQQWDNPHAGLVAARAGNDVVVSPTSHLYFDASNEAIPLKWVYGLEPMPSGLNAQSARHILGIEACLWTESKPTDQIADEFLWPRVLALAEVAWSPAETRDWAGFRARLLGAHFERLARMGLGAPDSRLPWAATRQALIDRSELEWGARVGSWTPAQMSETVKTLD